MDSTREIEEALKQVIVEFAKKNGLPPIVEPMTGRALSSKMTAYKPGDDVVGPMLRTQNDHGVLLVGFGLVVKKDRSSLAIAAGGWILPNGGARDTFRSSERTDAISLWRDVVKQVSADFDDIANNALARFGEVRA